MRSPIVFALAALSCGGGAIKQEDLGDELIKSLCAKYAECNAATSQQACLDFFGDDNNFIADYSTAIAAGKIKYDGAAARTCLDSYAKIPCAEFNSLGSTDDSCASVYAGQIPVGTTCASNTECVKDAYCAQMTSGMTCTGTCTMKVGAGGSATTSAACKEDLRLVMGMCVVPPAEGELCASGSLCASGLYCDDENHCRRPGGKGASCDRLARCATFFACIGGVCSDFVGQGASCGATDAGTTTSCKIDLYCQTDTKQCAPFGDVGATCLGSSACKGSLVCARAAGDAGTCQQAATEGQSCAMTSCDSATYCDSQMRICTKRIAVGQPCPSGTQCVSSAFCNAGTCQSFTTQCP